MKIIDAKWEKRNFGYDVTEVNIDNFDTIDLIKNNIENIESKYVVVKVPTKMTEVYKLLSNIGLYFAECLIDCQFNITDNVIESNDMMTVKSYSIINKDVEEVLNEIKNGNIFNTDRIYLDSSFPKEVSGVRYYNWANDLIIGGGDFVISYYNNDVFSFAILKNDNQYGYDCVLWGLMPNFQKKGYGKLLVNNTLQFVKMNGGKKLITTVSSNNIAIINCINKFNYKINSERYVFVRHL